MVAVAPAAQADAIVAWLRRRQPAWIIGQVRRGARGVSFV
jgi:hypothetical protein